ncbi:MAG: hypothetical protein ABNH21_06710 [Glaciecola sp.]|jgi:uncharacterized protein (UPF0262 family)
MTEHKEINKLNEPNGYHLYKDSGLFTIMQKDSERSHIISLTPEQLSAFVSDFNEVANDKYKVPRSVTPEIIGDEE